MTKPKKSKTTSDNPFYDEAVAEIEKDKQEEIILCTLQVVKLPGGGMSIRLVENTP